MWALPSSLLSSECLWITGLSCPECPGVLQVSVAEPDSSFLQFVCRNGSTPSLRPAAKEASIEHALRGCEVAFAEMIQLLDDIEREALRAPMGRRARRAARATGTVYVAPRDHNMMLEAGAIRLDRGPKQHYTRPAVDPLFTSAALEYGPRVGGVLVSGCGDDGVTGMIAVKRAGGIGLVQDPSEARQPSMPLAAILDDHVDGVLPVEDIARILSALAAGRIEVPG